MRPSSRFILIGFSVITVGVILAAWPWLRGALQFVTLPVLRPLSRSTDAIYAWVVCHRRDTASAIFNTSSKASLVDLAELQKTREENLTLRGMLHFSQASGHEVLGARVLQRTIDHVSARYLIDRGVSDGVELGQAVITTDGIYVGKISLAQEHVSFVTLLTDIEGRVAGRSVRASKVNGVIEGRGNGAAEMTYIPVHDRPNNDELVVTSGSDEKIPPFLPIGVINVVHGRPNDSFLSASIEPLVRLDQVALVGVLRAHITTKP